jgi:hypothetical protein
MRVQTSVLGLTVVLAIAGPAAHAATLCQKKSGALVVRATCKKHETAMSVGISVAGDLGLGTDTPTARLDVNGTSIFRDDVTFAAGQTFPDTATLGDNTFTGDQTIDGNLTVGSKIGIGTSTPSSALSAAGEAEQTFGMERNTTAASPGNGLTVQAGGSTVGAADLAGGDLVLAAGVGTGLGGSGNVRLQTAGAASASGTGDDVLIDRRIVVGKAKALTLSAPGFTSLASFAIPAGAVAGGRVRFTIRATDGGSQIATQTGTIVFNATANSITCTLAADTLHLGTVNAGCTPGFFNPGSQPGVSIFDNVSFSSPAPIVIHEVYFSVENDSGVPVRLEP